jgi:hypothetical protein
MKIRILAVFTLVVGLALVLTGTVAAQRAEVRDADRTIPNVAPTGPPANLTLAPQGPSFLGRTSRMTFTPAFTVYLPSVARNYDPLLLYFDDFSDPNSGWYSEDSEFRTVGYLNGEYQFLLKETQAGYLVTPNLTLPGNYRIEADARQASSNASTYGLMFGIRWGTDTYEGYQFIVDPAAQEYLLEKRNWDGSWPLLIDWTYGPAIREGMAVNHLRVDRIGTMIYLYINGTLATTYTDSSFTSSGLDAGVRAYSYDDAPVDVRFDNFGAYRTP